MDKLNEYIGLIADTVYKLVQEHGTQAVQLGMFVFQMEYIQGLLYGLMWTIITLVLFITGRILWGTGCALKKSRESMSRHAGMSQHDSAYRDPDPYLAFGLIAQLLSAIPLFVALVYLVNIYNWVGAFNPYAATALKVMSKAFK